LKYKWKFISEKQADFLKTVLGRMYMNSVTVVTA